MVFLTMSQNQSGFKPGDGYKQLQEVLYKKAFLKDLAIFIENTCVRASF